MLLGRYFTARDRAASTRVVILNESAARTYFGDRNPLGEKVTFPGQRVPDEYEIVGVVSDVRYESLRLVDERMAYLPIERAFDPIASGVIVVRTMDDAARHVAGGAPHARDRHPHGDRRAGAGVALDDRA